MRATLSVAWLTTLLVSSIAWSQSTLLGDTFQPKPDFTVPLTSISGLPQAFPKINAERYSENLDGFISQLGQTCSSRGEFVIWNDTGKENLERDELEDFPMLAPVVLDRIRSLGYPTEIYEVNSVKLRALGSSGFVLQTSTKPILGIIGESWYLYKEEQVYYTSMYWCMSS